MFIKFLVKTLTMLSHHIFRRATQYTHVKLKTNYSSPSSSSFLSRTNQHHQVAIYNNNLDSHSNLQKIIHRSFSSSSKLLSSSSSSQHNHQTIPSSSLSLSVSPLVSPTSNSDKPSLIAIHRLNATSPVLYYFKNPLTQKIYTTIHQNGSIQHSDALSSSSSSVSSSKSSRSEIDDLYSHFFPEYTSIYHRRIMYPFVKLLPSFLPSSYPHSVRPAYIKYTTWSMVQTAISSATGVLCMHSLILSLGFSSSVAFGSAAALTWILKDGLGQFGGMLFAGFVGRRFDDDAKRIRFLSCLSLDLAQSIEILLPFTPSLFLPLASLANIAKNISWLSASASKASIHRSLGKNENIAELTAKSGAQSIFASLVGTGFGLGGASIFPVKMVEGVVTGMTPILILFTGFTLVHLYTSYKSITIIALNTLNLTRTELLSRDFIMQTLSSSITPILSTPDKISEHESIIWKYISPFTNTSNLHIGGGMLGGEDSNTSSLLEDWRVNDIEGLLNSYEKYPYIVHTTINNNKMNIYIVYKSHATSFDVLQGFLYVTYLRHEFHNHHSINISYAQDYIDKWSSVWEIQLKNSEWNTQYLFIEKNEQYRIQMPVRENQENNVV